MTQHRFSNRTRPWFYLLILFSSLTAFSQQGSPIEPPIYPEGTAVPRNLTIEESPFLESYLTRYHEPLLANRGGLATPTGPLHCIAEYEPMDGILIAYEGQTGWLDILDQMAAQITTTGNADIYVMADDTGELNTIQTRMAAAGADLNRVQIFVVPTDTIWMRDYGPRYVYEGDVRIMVDHTYNRPRPNDNNLPANFAAFKNHQRYVIPLVHGGGNYHLHATALAHTTRLINDENPSLSEAEIRQLWQVYQNLDTSFYEPFPQAVDSTQHIDMWMQAIGDNEVIISDWPFAAGSIQDQICDGTADTLIQAGYTVHRVPARSVGGVHYTYTNVVMCNDLVLLPSYTNAQVSQHNAEALNLWETVLPAKTIHQVNCQAIVTAAGVMHCIVMHLPAARGGANPTAYLRTRPQGQRFFGGDQLEIQWISDDDLAVTDADLFLSLDGGNSYPFQIAADTGNSGAFQWNIPRLYTTSARLRVVVSDEDNNTGFDAMDTDFSILGSLRCPGDVAPELVSGSYGDDLVDQNDLDQVLAHWSLAPSRHDVNRDDSIDVLDGLAVLAAMGACPNP